MDAPTSSPYYVKEFISPPARGRARIQTRKLPIAQFKRLTSTSGSAIDINMNSVAYIYRGRDHSTVYFAVTNADGKLLGLGVKETLDEIAAASPGSPPPKKAAPAPTT